MARAKAERSGIRSLVAECGVLSRRTPSESNDRRAFESNYQDVTRKFKELREETRTSVVGLLAVYGGTIATLAHRLPIELQAAAKRRATEMFARLEQLQEEADLTTCLFSIAGKYLPEIAQSNAFPQWLFSR